MVSQWLKYHTPFKIEIIKVHLASKEQLGRSYSKERPIYRILWKSEKLKFLTCFWIVRISIASLKNSAKKQMEIQNKIKENVKKETKERIYYQEKRSKRRHWLQIKWKWLRWECKLPFVSCHLPCTTIFDSVYRTSTQQCNTCFTCTAV